LKIVKDLFYIFGVNGKFIARGLEAAEAARHQGCSERVINVAQPCRSS
jgi:hypothetical protein